jgi:hypothetical protein
MVAPSASLFRYPASVKVTTGIRLRVLELPTGVRTPPTFTITAATPSGAAVSVTLTAAALTGATSLTVSALSGAIPAYSVLSIGGQVVITSAAAASAAVAITVYPLNFDIANGTILSYSPGALTLGTTLLPVNALPCLIDVGEILTFTGGMQVYVTGRAPLGAQQIQVAPTSALLTTGNTATTNGLLAVVGCTSSPVPSAEPKAVETTNLLSGTGVEKKLTAVGYKMKVEFNQVTGDLGGGVLLGILRNPNKLAKEVYFQVITSEGETHTGAAIVTAGPEAGNIQDIRKISCELQVQGLSYAFTAATADANFY